MKNGNKKLLEIEITESMMPGFRKLLKILVKGKKDVSYVEGFFDGMITMKKIEMRIDIEEGD